MNEAKHPDCGEMSTESSSNSSSGLTSGNVFLGFSVIILLLMLTYPWLIGLVSLSFVAGYFSLDFLNNKLKPILLQQLSSLRRASIRSSTEVFDPLLHIGPTQDQVPGACTVCSMENCSRDVHGEHVKPLKVVRRIDQDIRIPQRLNASISKFCTAVFDTYISPSWAPYETRHQLRLAFTKLLTRFAERIQRTFLLNEGNTHNFCKQKILPLLFYHLSQPTTGSSLSSMDEKRANWKVRRLSRMVLQKCLSAEEQKCKLWMELCVNVLADGVLWNLIILGKRQLPELLESYTNEYLESLSETGRDIISRTEPIVPTQTKPRNPSQGIDENDGPTTTAEAEPESLPRIQVQFQSPQLDESSKNVPFLLETFLDPCHDVEQPASIVSRWRPTLNDVLQERDLLYCIIQYLRDQSALEYLQAVMDQSPDGSSYCRKILELEYLPGFCRSRIFLENLGLSRVDLGLEVTEPSVNDNGSNYKKSSNHTRSVSYGGVASGTPTVWKLGQNVVDGFAIPSNSSAATIAPLVFPTTGTVEPDSIFRRKQHVLEVFISKFYASVVKTSRGVFDILGEIEPRRRFGVDTRNYEEEFHPYVIGNVSVTKCDILKSISDTVTSRISRNSWTKSIVTGWINLLHPFVNSIFHEKLDEGISELLNLDHFVQFIDLITDAFVRSQQAEAEAGSSVRTQSSTATQTEDSVFNQFSKSSISWMIRQLIDTPQLIHGFKENRDQIILFFVDVLDVFVNELCSEGSGAEVEAEKPSS